MPLAINSFFYVNGYHRYFLFFSTRRPFDLCIATFIGHAGVNGKFTFGQFSGDIHTISPVRLN